MISKEQSEEIQKAEEDEEIERVIKSAKTGVPITIKKSYGVIDPDGNDTGKRFFRKEDADEYSELLKLYWKKK